MAGQTGPNDPGGDEPTDQVRQLQRQLWAAAKRAPARRFHTLYDQMCRDDILREAWKRVRRNRGAAGIDRVSIQSVEQYGVQRFLQELGEVLRAGEYGAQVVRSVIAELNPVLRGWGQYFRSGNAANHFIDVDDYVVKRLRSLRIKRAGRHLRAGQAERWSRAYFESLGLHRLRGTIRYAGPSPFWQQEAA